MGTHTLHDAITTLRAANTTADEAIAAILTTAHQIHPDDRENAHALLEAAEAIGRSEQARHGQLIQLLAQIDRIRANKGGLAPWIATHLDVTREDHAPSPNRHAALGTCPNSRHR